METTTTKPEKKSRPRKVFGRVRVMAGGKAVTVNLTKTALIVRPLHARRTYSLPLERAAILAMANAPLT